MPRRQQRALEAEVEMEAIEVEMEAADAHQDEILEQIDDLDPRAIMLLSSRDPRRRAFEAQVAEKLRDDPKPAPAAAPEPRAALRMAIEEHQAAVRRVADLTKALPAVDAAVMEARSAVEAATRAVEETKAAAAAHATAKALGTAGAAPPSLKDARAQLTDAEDALAVAAGALTDLAKQHEEAQRALSWSRPDDAIAAVVRADPATQKLIEGYERARQQYADLRQAVELVAGFLPYGEQLALLSERLDNTPGGTRSEWERALTALQENADAALPI